jgi:hypothetical protein
METKVSETSVPITATEKSLVSNTAGLPDVVTIRKINKLANFSKFGKPRFFGQERYKPDSDQGSDIELEYNASTLPGATRNLHPQWDRLNGCWAWKGEFSDLSRIAGVLRLRDDKQQPIFPDKYSFKNSSDPFFNHKSLWNNKAKRIMEGSVTLKPNEQPLDEFYARTYLGNPFIQNSLENQAKSTIAGAELEVWSPKAETLQKKAAIDKEDDAIVALKGMSIETQRIISNIMRPTGYNPKSENTDLLFVQLREGAAKNTVTATKFGGQTWQDRFLELAGHTDEVLYIMARIIEGRYSGALVKDKGMYRFKERTLYNDGTREIKDDNDLITFFRKPENDPVFQELIDWMDKKV